MAIGSVITKSINANGIMLTGMSSVDDLAIEHEVKYFIKLARDYSNSSTEAMNYSVVFHNSKSDISSVRNEFANDSNIEFAELVEIDNEVCWDPMEDDFLFNFAPYVTETGEKWPWFKQRLEGDDWYETYPVCSGNDSLGWSATFTEQWPLYNDGDIFANTDSVFCPLPEWQMNPVAGEDINALDAWGFYLSSGAPIRTGKEDIVQVSRLSKNRY